VWRARGEEEKNGRLSRASQLGRSVAATGERKEMDEALRVGKAT
jgi:hypothetical protein